MLSTKIRTTVVALVTAFSAAGVAAVPTTAQAMGIKLVLKPSKVVTVCVHNPLTGKEYCETRTVKA